MVGARSVLEAWQQRLRAAVEALQERDPLAAGLSLGAAWDLLPCPMRGCCPTSSTAHGWKRTAAMSGFPAAEIPRRRRASHRRAGAPADRTSVHAPEAEELAALGLGARELAAAERTGRLLRLRDGVGLLPTAPALAMRYWPAWLSPSPRAKRVRRWIRPAESQSRCWNTLILAAGPGAWTPATAPWRVEPHFSAPRL